MDNRWIVPNNPFLLLRYDCHLNVEITISVTAVKYLYKYVYKGHDMASLCVTRAPGANDNPELLLNEILRYSHGRWITSTEAMYRIFDFPIHSEKPNVIRLQVHLPRDQTTFFADNATLETIPRPRASSLTAWFTFNVAARARLQEIHAWLQQHASTESIRTEATRLQHALRTTYQDFPSICTWVNGEKKWKLRSYKQTQPTIGRLVHVSVSNSERFYLRVLLTYVPGPQASRT